MNDKDEESPCPQSEATAAESVLVGDVTVHSRSDHSLYEARQKCFVISSFVISSFLIGVLSILTLCITLIPHYRCCCPEMDQPGAHSCPHRRKRGSCPACDDRFFSDKDPCFQNKHELQTAATYYFTDDFRDMVVDAYGPISSWCVGNVTNFDYVLDPHYYLMYFHVDRDEDEFNEPLGDWDVSKATSMKGLFQGLRSFNQPLDSWDVSRVTDMSQMFQDCMDFNQPLNSWNVRNVENMEEMFEYARSFNQPLDSWDTSKVEDMRFMFAGCENFNQSLATWNVANVEAMRGMFDGSPYHGQKEIWSEWDTSAVKDNGLCCCPANADDDACPHSRERDSCPECDDSYFLRKNPCFQSRRELREAATYYFTYYKDLVTDAYGPVSSWCVGNVSNFDNIFAPSWYHDEFLYDLDFSSNLRDEFNEPLQDWDVSSATSMAGMFRGCISFNQPLSNWNVSQVRRMDGMFEGCKLFNQPLDGWDTSRVQSMDEMFLGCMSFNQPLSSWDVSQVHGMFRMFNGCTSFRQDLCSWSNQLSFDAETVDMFTGTSCPVKSDPAPYNPSAPMCERCH